MEFIKQPMMLTKENKSALNFKESESTPDLCTCTVIFASIDNKMKGLNIIMEKDSFFYLLCACVTALEKSINIQIFGRNK